MQHLQQLKHSVDKCFTENRNYFATVKAIVCKGVALPQITTAIATEESSIDGALNGVFSVSSTVITTAKCAGVVIQIIIMAND